MTRRRLLAASTPGAAPAARHPFSARAAAGEAHLRLMETTDLHMHIFPYDYYADRPVDTVGLARTAAHIADLRAEAINAMLLDNGDFLQGNPMGDFIACERGMKAGDIHPMIAALNALNYDAATVGNHEFNYGLDFLTKAVAGARFPVVLANVARQAGARPTADATLFEPYVILERRLVDGAGQAHPIRIGLIGFTPPQIMRWDARHLEGRVTARDILATARAWVPQMKEAGADIIVALSHSGIGPATETDLMENASVPLAAIPGIDAVLTGHNHLVFPSPAFEGFAAVDARAGTLHGTPATMGGFWGSHLGVIDLLLSNEGGAWRVLAHDVETRAISRRAQDGSVTALVESDPAVLAAAQGDHDATLAYVRRPVGKTSAPLHSHFALVAGAPSVTIVQEAQKRYVAGMLKGTEHASLPLLSAAAPFKAGGRAGPEYYTDVPAGDIAIRNVADLYLYPNTVRAVRVTGAELRDWLERSAGIFNRIVPGKPDQALLNPDFPSHHFDVIDGVSYRIDLSRPPKFDTDGALAAPGAGRITTLAFDGAPVTDEMVFAIATNDYRASGGGGFPGADGDTIILEAPDANRDVVMRYIVEEGRLAPLAGTDWGFAPLPGTSVIFETGPGAAKYLGEITTMKIEPAGDGAEGFARYRITL